MVFLFIGFPYSWEKALAILTGLIIIIFAYRIRFKENSFANGSSFTDNISSSAKQVEQIDNPNDQVSTVNDQESVSVIPAKAGIQGKTLDSISNTLDSRIRGNDKKSPHDKSQTSISNSNSNSNSQSTPDAEE